MQNRIPENATVDASHVTDHVVVFVTASAESVAEVVSNHGKF